MTSVRYDLSEVRCPFNSSQAIPNVPNDRRRATTTSTNSREYSQINQSGGELSLSKAANQPWSGSRSHGQVAMSQVFDKTNGASEHEEGHLAHSMSFRRSSAQNLKGNAIHQACLDRDIDKLIRLTETSGGLLDDSLRQTACKHCVSLATSPSTNADEKGQYCLVVNNHFLQLIPVTRLGNLSQGIVTKTRFSLT